MYRDASECAREHVRRERKVWRESFIAARWSATCAWWRRAGAVLVFFFYGNYWVGMSGHEAAWRRSRCFQVCERRSVEFEADAVV
jgi:hypothetical protein